MIRSSLIALLLGITLALLSLALWGRSEVNDPDRFAASSRSALSQPEVQALLAERITSEVWEEVDTEELLREVLPSDAEILSGPADLAARAALSQGIARVLGTSWAQDIWTESVRTTYSSVLRALQNRNSALLVQEESVYVDLGLAAQVAARKIGLPQELWSEIPAGLSRIELARTEDVYKIQRAYQVLEVSPLPLFLVCLVLALIILVIQRRQLWTAPAFLAGSFLLGGLLVLLATPTVEPFLLGSLRDPLSAEIAAVVWQDWSRAIASGGQKLLLLGGGLGLLAGALSPPLAEMRQQVFQKTKDALARLSN